MIKESLVSLHSWTQGDEKRPPQIPDAAFLPRCVCVLCVYFCMCMYVGAHACMCICTYR